MLFYDLLGLPFLLFMCRRPKTLVVWSVVALAPLLLIALALTVTAFGDPARGARERPSMPALSADLSGPAERAYGSDSYPEMVAQRIREYFVTLPLSLLYSGLQVFAMMLLGAAAVNAGWTGDREGLPRRTRRAAVRGLLVWLPLNLFYAVSAELDPVGSTYMPPLGADAA